MKPTVRKPPHSAGAVCLLADISYRELDSWTRTALVVPSVRRAGGSGRGRLYSDGDVAKLRLIKDLRECGVSLQRIRRDADPHRTLLSLLDELGALSNSVMEKAS